MSMENICTLAKNPARSKKRKKGKKRLKCSKCSKMQKWHFWPFLCFFCKKPRTAAFSKCNFVVGRPSIEGPLAISISLALTASAVALYECSLFHSLEMFSFAARPTSYSERGLRPLKPQPKENLSRVFLWTPFRTNMLFDGTQIGKFILIFTNEHSQGNLEFLRNSIVTYSARLNLLKWQFLYFLYKYAFHAWLSF